METVVFGAFIVLQIAFRELPNVAKWAGKFVIVQKLANNHWLVWIFHPAVLHGLQDYAVHLVVYSGYILRGH